MRVDRGEAGEVIVKTQREGHCKRTLIISEGDGNHGSVLSRGGKCAHLIGLL